MAWGMRNILICLYGSSIMEGRIGVEDPRDRWYNLLQQQLSTAHPDTCFPIVNSAVGGESTREVMARLDRDVLRYRPDLCLFMVGGNNHDCRNPDRMLADGELGALLDHFTCKLDKETKPVGVTLGPVVDDWHFATTHPAYREYLAEFSGSLDASLEPDRKLLRTFCRRQGWPCLDLYALLAADRTRYILPNDGIHLNKAGHALFARKMVELINTLL